MKPFLEDTASDPLIEAVAAGIDPKASLQALTRFANTQMLTVASAFSDATKGEPWLTTEQ
jgi:hypothetical protein